MTEKNEATKATSSLAERARGISFSVIGSIPKGKINAYGGGIGVRFNCQSGNVTDSTKKALGNKLSINIIKAEKYFGDLE